MQRQTLRALSLTTALFVFALTAHGLPWWPTPEGCNNACGGGGAKASSSSTIGQVVALQDCSCLDGTAAFLKATNTSGWTQISLDFFNKIEDNQNAVYSFFNTDECLADSVDAFLDVVNKSPDFFPCANLSVGDVCGTFCQDLFEVFQNDCVGSNPGIVGNEPLLSAFEQQGFSREDAAVKIQLQCLARQQFDPSASVGDVAPPPPAIASNCDNACGEDNVENRERADWYSVMYAEACTCKQPVVSSTKFYFVANATGVWSPITAEFYQRLLENGRVLDITLLTPECQAADINPLVAVMEDAGGPAFFCSGLAKNVSEATCNTNCRAWMQALGEDCLESQPEIIDSDALFTPFTDTGMSMKEAVSQVYSDCRNGAIIAPRSDARGVTPGVTVMLGLLLAFVITWGV